MNRPFAKMTAPPDNLTETPLRNADGGPRLDVLDEILRSLRLTGGVVIDAEFSGDYCVRAELTPKHCAPWFSMPQTMIMPIVLLGVFIKVVVLFSVAVTFFALLIPIFIVLALIATPFLLFAAVAN